MLHGFAKEAESALSKIREGIESFLRDPNQHEALEDAYQCMQSIKDASEMLGLQVLSDLILCLEEMVEDLATAPLPLHGTRRTWLRQAVEQLEGYLVSALSDDGQAQGDVIEMVRAFRRFKELPESGDKAAVQEILGVDVDMPASTAPAPVSSAPTASAPAEIQNGTPAVPQDEASDELVEGFWLEAEDYLNTIGRILPDIDKAPHQREQLQSVRRSVHTFKGAAGVVGFRPVAQLAHRMEDVLDELYEDSRPLTPQVKDLLLATFDTMDEFVRSKGHMSHFEAAAQTLYRSYTTVLEAQPAETSADTAVAPVGSAPAPQAEVPTTRQDEVSDELIEGFLLEAEDYLNIIGRTLPDIDQAPNQHEQILSVRRSVHTFKGAAGVVGFRTASQLAHHMENVLDELYEGHHPLTPQDKDLLLVTFDALDEFIRSKGHMSHFEATAQRLQNAYTTVWTGTPADVVPAQSAPEPASMAASASKPTSPEVQPVAPVSESTPEQPGAEGQDLAPSTVHQIADVLRVPLDRVDDLVRLVSELVISRSAYEQHLGRLTHQIDELRLSIERLRRTSTTVETQYEVRALGGQGLFAPQVVGANDRPREAKSVTPSQEFDILEFDRYSEFTLVARELTETTADMAALGQEFGDVLGDFDGYLTRQGRLTSEIQDKLMRLRMVPLATLATRLHRAVRVTARERAKAVEFVLEGDDVEFDKTMLEEMAEPLLHLLRNAVDHGIEPPATRQTLGKSQQGQIHLRAFREGTQVVLQLRDDGAGLDPQQLRAAAVRGGFVSEAEAAQRSDEQLYALIFKPGFSTAQEVSEISGRGVGMDVVQATVSRLKGHVTINSTPGQGITFTIRLPLTLAITRVLLVKAHGETLAVPLADVAQIVRLEPEAIERVGGVPAVRVDGQVLPVVWLGERLGLPQPTDSTTRLLPIVVVQAGERQVAFVVDELIGAREVVVKTLGSHLRRVHGVIGSTLMGDGSVVLILNPVELARDEQRQGTAPQKAAAKPRTTRAREVLDILIVDDSFSVRRVVSTLIKSVGWNPILAKDGLEALDIMQRATTPPDLILLDVEMPQMDGYEFTSTLRAQTAYRHLPIVMLTSRSGEKHRQKALEVGATEYLVKPYQDDVLLSTIRRLVPPAEGVSAA